MDEAFWPRRKVGFGEVALGQGGDVLVAYALGSCVGVALVDASRKVGGLAHVMLPVFAEGPGDDNPLKYADRAVPALLRELVAAGACRGDVVGRIAGGASMFPEIPRESVGERNVRAVQVVLRELGVPVVARDVGGDHGRTVELHVGNGGLLVRSFRKGALWI